MSLWLPPAAILLYGLVRLNARRPSRRSESNSERLRDRSIPRKFINELNDDCLLIIFSHCQPVLLEEYDGEVVDKRDIVLAGGRWRERWWLKLAQVCRRWRGLILESPSHLHLSLVCTTGTPVATMLAHHNSSRRRLPLILDYFHLDPIISKKDVNGLILALLHRNCVRRIRLRMPVQTLRRLINAIDKDFPMLEYLYIEPLNMQDTRLSLPESLQAQGLRHLVLVNFAFPIGSPLLKDLVTLSLENIHLYIYFNANELLQRLSLMPQLETFRISSHSPLSNRNVERQLLKTPLSTDVKLPKLRWFGFGGASAYMNAVLPRITMPLLKVIEIMFFNQPSDSMLFILRFLCKTENPRFGDIRVTFCRQDVVVMMYAQGQTGMYAIRMRIICEDLDMQVASVVQIFNGVRLVFTEAESLILEHETSFKGHTESPGRAPWRELLRPFHNVKVLHVTSNLTEELSRSLRPDYGESPIELLPELELLSYSASSYNAATGESFGPFIHVRQNVGFPVILVPSAEIPKPLFGDTVVMICDVPQSGTQQRVTIEYMVGDFDT